VLERWRAACPQVGLPSPFAAEACALEHLERSLVLSVDFAANPPAFHLMRMGDALARALGQAALGDRPFDGPAALGSLGGAYRRALRSRFPIYEYTRYTFASDAMGEFERLISPAASDGKTVSHLIGVVILPFNPASGR
jgi:hypothetical protein